MNRNNNISSIRMLAAFMVIAGHMGALLPGIEGGGCQF